MSPHRPRQRRLIVEALEDRNLLSADIFLNIGGIEGEVEDKHHKKEIELLSYAWGTTNAGGGSNANVSEISIVKLVDAATPKLLEAATKGKHLGKVEITLVDQDPNAKVQYFKYELKEVFISGFQTSGGGAVPHENITLSFERIKWEYKEQGMKKAKGDSSNAFTPGPDINGDGTRDPLFFNYALLTDLNHDGVLDIIVAGDVNGDGVPDSSLVADLNGDASPDRVLPATPGPGAVQVDFRPYTPLGMPSQRLVQGDYNGDGQVDAVFALDVNGDGIADLLTSIKAIP